MDPQPTQPPVNLVQPENTPVSPVPVSSKKPKQKRCHLILLSGLCQRFLMLILKVQLVCNITEWRTEVKLVGKKKYRRRFWLFSVLR